MTRFDRPSSRQRAYPALAFVALFAVVLASCGPRALTPGHAAAIQDSVSTLLADYAGFSSEGDLAGLAELYLDEPGFVWAEDGGIRYRAVAEVRASLESLSAGMDVTTVLDDTRILPMAPGVAWVTTAFETRVGGAQGGFSYSGMITMTVVHRDAGWKIAGGHTSTARPSNR